MGIQIVITSFCEHKWNNGELQEESQSLNRLVNHDLTHSHYSTIWYRHCIRFCIHSLCILVTTVTSKWQFLSMIATKCYIWVLFIIGLLFGCLFFSARKILFQRKLQFSKKLNFVVWNMFKLLFNGWNSLIITVWQGFFMI